MSSSPPSDKQAQIGQAAERWINGWARGWATHDVELIASLYSEGAVHLSAPFRDPQPTADYAAWAFADEEGAEVWFAAPIVEGDRAAVAWWGISHEVNGSDTTLAGVSLLRFGTDGLVVDQRDYWNEAKDSAIVPPEAWGPVAAHERSSFG